MRALQQLARPECMGFEFIHLILPDACQHADSALIAAKNAQGVLILLIGHSITCLHKRKLRWMDARFTEDTVLQVEPYLAQKAVDLIAAAQGAGARKGAEIFPDWPADGIPVVNSENAHDIRDDTGRHSDAVNGGVYAAANAVKPAEICRANTDIEDLIAFIRDFAKLAQKYGTVVAFHQLSRLQNRHDIKGFACAPPDVRSQHQRAAQSIWHCFGQDNACDNTAVRNKELSQILKHGAILYADKQQWEPVFRQAPIVERGGQLLKLPLRIFHTSDAVVIPDGILQANRH